MRYCAQCGEMLEDGDIFCPNCGTKQREEEAAAAAGSVGAAFAGVYGQAPAGASAENAGAADQYAYGEAGSLYSDELGQKPVKQKKKKKGLIISLAVIGVLLAAIAALYFTGAYAALLPHSKLKLGLAEKKVYDKIITSRQLQDIEGDRFSFDLDIDIDVNDDCYESDEQLYNTLNQLGLVLNYDTVGNGIGLKAEYKGNPAADFRIICGEDTLGFYLSPASDEYYTTTVKSLMDRLAPDGDMDDVDFTVLFDKIDMSGVRSDIEAIKNIAADSLKKANVEITKNVEVQLFNGGETRKGAVYTITLTEQQMTELLNNIADYLDSDACYTAKLYDRQLKSPLSAILGGVMLSGDLDMIGEIDLDPDEQGFGALVDEFRKQIPELAKNYVEEGIKLEVVMDGSMIIRQRIYNDEYSFGYDHVKSGNAERTMLFVEEEGYVDYTAVENGGVKNIDVKVCEYDSEPMAQLTARINTSSRSIIGTYEGVYELTVQESEYDDPITVKMEVTPAENGMEHKVSVEFDEDNAYYYGMDSLEFKALVYEGEAVEAPSGVKNTDITDYSDMQFYMLLFKLSSGLEDVLGDIFG